MTPIGTVKAFAAALPVVLLMTLTVLTAREGDPGAVRPSGGPVEEYDMSLRPADPPRARPARVPVVRSGRAPAATGRGQRVALRQLVVAVDGDDVQLSTWKAVLDKIGTPYDVLLARHDGLDEADLVRSDGSGRYSSVLLTSGSLLYRAPSGTYRSALTSTQWRALWSYERTFHVRQVALNASPRSEPEDYCLRLRDEGSSETATATLTTRGAEVFERLSPSARLPLGRAYVYRSRMRAVPGCSVEPLLKVGRDVVAALSRSDDGRERLALTFTLGAGQPVEELLGYGLVRWATRGVLLGEQRHWIGVDVDDWFNTNYHGLAGGSLSRYRISGEEATAVARQQAELRRRHPLAAAFTLTLAYNGNGMVPPDAPGCRDGAPPDPLTSTSVCLRQDFRWINHTFSHEAMNDLSYERSLEEITRNLAAAAKVGLAVPQDVLKTPEYSGLGVYNPDRSQPFGSVTDHGLGRSNPDLLRAAKDAGVRYLHGNMSFRSHQPDCHNCGRPHPLRPELFIVPDWPTNVAWEATTPQEQVSRYNAVYGAAAAPGARDRTYDEIMALEAELGLRHVMAGSAYVHTLHQTNLRQYAPGRSLAFDWLDTLLTRYEAWYRAPLLSPGWNDLAAYVKDRTAHFAALRTGPDAVWNRVTDDIEYVPGADATIFFTGLETRPADDAQRRGPDEAEEYAGDTVSRLALPGGQPVVLRARPRS